MPLLLWSSQAAAAHFDLKLYVGGAECHAFGDITVTRSISGIGTSGISTAQLTVTAAAPLSAYRAAPVILSGVGNLPTFYINSRSQQNGMVTLTCLDRMAYTDETFNTAWVEWDSEKTALTSAVLDMIYQKCGFTGRSGYSIPSYLTRIDKAHIEGRSCADILTMLGDLQCGFWYCDADDRLCFLTMGTASGIISVSEHSALKIGNDYRPEGVRVTNGSKAWERGSTTYGYNTIQIHSDFGCDDTARDVYDRIKNKSYNAVTCDNCIISALSVPFVGSDITFAENDTAYHITSVTARISGTGVDCSLAANDPSGGEISQRTKLARMLDNAGCRKYGKMMLAPYQDITYYVDEEEK